MARSADPKYGRFILPLVIAGMVGATWAFVNSLEPAEVPDSATTLPPVENTTTIVLPGDTTTSTTLPENVQAYLTALEAFVTESQQLVERARQINNDWDSDAISFSEAENQLRQLAADTQTFTNRLKEADVIPALEAAQIPMNDAADAMVDAANGMVTGLLDPDSRAGRVQAFADYQAAADELAAGLVQVRQRAVGADPGAGVTDTTGAGTEDGAATTSTTFAEGEGQD